MIFWRNLSIKRKLMLIIMVASTVALLLVSAGFVTYELVTFRQKMVRDLSTLAGLIGNRSTAALNFENQEDAEEDLSSLRANKHIVAACLYKGDIIFARYPKDSNSSRFPPPQRNRATFEADHLILFREIAFKGQTLGTLYLKSDLHEMRERLALYGGIVALLMVASLAVTFLLSSLLQRIITAP